MTIRVRVAIPSDAAAIAAVHIGSWREGYRGLVPDRILDNLSSRARERRWHEILTDGNARTSTIVAHRADGAIIGFCSTIAPARDAGVPDRTAEIAALYVAPPQWRTGVGCSLLTATLDRLHAEGWSAAILWVLAGNARALAFYDVAGFRPDGASRTEPVGSVERAEGLQQLRLQRPLAGDG